MINFRLDSFMRAVWMIRQLIVEFTQPIQSTDEPVAISDTNKERLNGVLRFAHDQCGKLGLRAAEHRFERMSTVLKTIPQVNHAWALVELNTLMEAIEDDSKFERFFHYRRDRAMLVLSVSAEWGPAITAFPTARPEIEDAADCFAMEHPTAAVFHLMRVAEYGLRALATERRVKLPKRKPLEWGTWQDLIRGIKDAADSIAKTKRAGPGKDDALGFYNGAVAHFDAFKDQYRNMVMHFRKRYDEVEAQIALTHVRDFMNGLSLRVGETTRGPIKWKFQ